MHFPTDKVLTNFNMIDLISERALVNMLANTDGIRDFHF